MARLEQWHTEPGPRVEGSRELDSAKVQAPCIVEIPTGGYRLFYTGVGPGKPFRHCQGYILSAVSSDGLRFEVEPGIRLAPQAEVPHMSLRTLVPSVVERPGGGWRMYFEARGTADRPTVICSAVSDDMVNWEREDGIRLDGKDGLGGPRLTRLPDGRCRLYCFASEYGPGGRASGERIVQGVVSGISDDGVNFELEPGYRLRERQVGDDVTGITAAEVIPPVEASDDWMMVYSAWHDVPAGADVPVHPSMDVNAVESGASEDFAAASIAADMAGFRSGIYLARSEDGLRWEGNRCILTGAGYGQQGIDAVHAEDMSLINLGNDRYRMYYAACDKDGNWRIASAVSE